MVGLETVLRAAQGDSAAAAAVRGEFESVGAEEWIRWAIETRLDPVLVQRVVPEAHGDAVSRVLDGFYRLWGCWFPGEYVRVRREWIALQCRWAGKRVESGAGQGVLRELLRGGLLDPRPVVRGPVAGGFEGGLEEPRVDVPGEERDVDVDVVGGERAPDSVGNGGDGGLSEGEAREDDGPGAPLVHPGDGVGGRLPDGTSVLADLGGDLVLREVSRELDLAMRSGPAAADAFARSWVESEGFWREWPSAAPERDRGRGR